MLRISIYILAILVSFSQLAAQVSPGKYYVQFSDKNNSPYSLNQPEEYLTQRAIERRTTQNIPIDMRDIPVNPSYLNGVRNAGAVILNPTKWLNGVTIETNDPAVISAIAALPYVVDVKMGSMKTVESEIPKDFFKNGEYGVAPSVQASNKQGQTSDYGSAYNQIHMVRGDEIHDMGYRGEGIVIGVLDSGFDRADEIAVFNNLWADNRVLGTKDFITGGPVTFDTHHHGTGVLSIMAADLPGTMIGTAPKASYYLLRTEYAPNEFIIEEYNWVSGAEFADSVGCDVLNTSLGYSTFDDTLQNHTYADMDGNTTPITIGADIAASKGMIVVNSAGNYGANAWYYITAPADGDSVFTIGAVNAQGIPWISSGNGPTSDGRIKPDITAQGEGTYFATPSGSITNGNGTSLSSPIIAGMMACLLQSMPDRTNMELINMVKESASISDNPDNKIGYGIPDFVSAHLLSVYEHGNESFFEEITAYPNPFVSSISMSFTAAEPGIVQISLVDLTGRKIREQSFSHAEGSNTLYMDDLENIPGGIYFVRIENGSAAISAKLIKQ